MAYTLAILGCGTMGQAVLSAIYNAPKASSPEKAAQYPSRIVTINNSPAGAARVQSVIERSGASPNGIAVTCLSGPQADLRAELVVVATKPYQLESVLETYSALLAAASQVVSLAAGWTIEQIQGRLASPATSAVSRVMTNTPAKYGWGSAVISHSANTDSGQKERSQELFQHLGMCVELPERNMDAATALVGSGPAFVLLMMESMMEGGIKMGIPLEESRKLAANVLEGTSRMAAATGVHPSVLKHQVCTPGGNTIAGLCVMEDRGVKSGIVKGIEEATHVAARLGKSTSGK